jgi:hypothetical protein
MKQLLIIFFLNLLFCAPIHSQQNVHLNAPHNKLLKLRFVPVSRNLTILNDSLKQYEIISYVFAIAWKNGTKSYIETVNGSKITLASRNEIAKINNGDKLVITQVIVKNKKGKEFEIDPISLTIKNNIENPTNVKPANGLKNSTRFY